jgi:predicted O-methyltransferase YrrM
MTLMQAIETVERAPAKLLPEEKLMLFSLVLGLRPAMALEIGTLWGGSAQIIVTALDMNGAGALACVDPAPQINAATLVAISHRAHVLVGRSPESVPVGPFDFVFIDGDHSTEGVLRDGVRAVEVLAPMGSILFHDNHHKPVSDGIDALLFMHAERLVDCGVITSGETWEAGVRWGGFRLVRSVAAR